MENPNSVEIVAFDDDGQEIARSLMPTRNWYADPQPLIDSEQERMRKRVVCIEGTQFGARGEVLLRWKSVYAPNGSEIEGWEWDKNGKEQYTRLAPSV